MRKLSIARTAATTLVAVVSLFGGNTQAAVVAAPNGILAAGSALNPVQNVQIYYLDGRQYCWYDNGWHGPGWYWCDNYLTYGIGWGGGYGWHGWRGGHRGDLREHRRHDDHKKPLSVYKGTNKYKGTSVYKGTSKPRVTSKSMGTSGKHH